MGRRRFEPEEGEEVLLETGPHWLRLVPRLASPVVLVVAGVAGFLLWASAPVWFGFVLLAAWLVALALAGGRVAAWRSTSFVVTSSRVVYRRGVLRRTGREVPIARVQDVSYRQGLLGRLVGIGEVRVESAGSGSTELVGDLRRPAEVQRVVNRALMAALDGAGRPPAGDGLAGRLERLDDLRRRGIVTEVEFARKKAELLERM